MYVFLSVRSTVELTFSFVKESNMDTEICQTCGCDPTTTPEPLGWGHREFLIEEGTFWCLALGWVGFFILLFHVRGL